LQFPGITIVPVEQIKLNKIFYPMLFWFSHVIGVHLQLSMKV